MNARLDPTDMLRLDGYTVDYIEPAGGKYTMQSYIHIIDGIVHKRYKKIIGYNI